MTNFDTDWNIVLGVISILLALQAIIKWINKQLPSKRLRTMYELLDDADALFFSCSAEGLVRGDKAVGFRRNLTRLRESAEAARLEAHAAKSYADDFKNMLKGLTQKIDKICEGAKDIRAQISTTSMRERERRAAERLAEEGTAVVPSPPESVEAVVSDETIESETEAPGGAIDALDLQVATPLREAASPLPVPSPTQLPTSPTTDLAPADVPHATHVAHAMASMIAIAPMATIRPSRKKVRHSDRRCSVSSNSSGSVASSLHSARWKCKGDPLSRARAMADLLRYTRIRQRSGLPVYWINPQQLAVCKLAEEDSDSSDDDWVDELAVRVVA